MRQNRDFRKDIPVPTFPAGTRAVDIISGIPGAIEYQPLVVEFTDYPVKSYMGPAMRATLYAMIRALRPQWAVEIGTLFAGTAEIIAGALAANGNGKLTTIDPFGAERVPDIIASWPQELQRATDFKPINSMQFFMDIEGGAERPDFIFIDGNHEYEYALFDLLNSARYLKLGGIIVLDNYCDYGVRLAAQKFQADNPTWEVVKFTAHPAFGTTYYGLQLDGLYRVYVGPKTVPIGTQPRGFTQIINADGVKGIDLKLAEPSCGGRLFYKIYLRIYPFEFHLGIGQMEEMTTSGDFRIEAGTLEAHAQLPVPIATLRPREGFHRRCEINLLFEPDVAGKSLTLNDDPAPALYHRT